MNEIIFIVEESAEGGYEAKALGYSIFTEADTIDDLKQNIREAIHCHFETIVKPLLFEKLFGVLSVIPNTDNLNPSF